MTVEELKIALEQNRELVLVDVREPYELQICKLENAMQMPMSIFAERFTDLPRDKELIVFCHHGIRSQMVVNFLKQQAYAHVNNLEGGIDQWAIRIDPTMKRY